MRRSISPRGSASSISCIASRTRRSAFSSAMPARKASTRVAWEGIDQPLDEGNWPLVSASPQQYLRGVSQQSREATHEDLREIEAQFVRATRNVGGSGFRLARTALRARLFPVELPLAAHQPSHRRIRRLARKSSALSAARCSRRCARSGRKTSRCPCAFPRTTGSKAAPRPTTPSRSHAPSRRRART